MNYKKVSSTHYLVQSRSTPDTWHHVVKRFYKGRMRWHCGCPAHIFRGSCNHIKKEF